MALPAILTLAVLASCTSATPTPKPQCPTAAPSAESAEAVTGDTTAVEVRTNKGNFTITLAPEDGPIATANFVALVGCGFYDGISFHRVLPGFVAQAGDPATKSNRDDFAELGTGGPGYRFEVELPPESTTYQAYMVAMANAMQYDLATGEILGGTDTNGSQFFVMLADTDSLLPYYSVLGTVSAGTEVVDAIGQVPTNGERGVPLDPVIIDEMVLIGAPSAS
jgi:cyclophilin family peptidyl-prolyl cis-trans isomerase